MAFLKHRIVPDDEDSGGSPGDGWTAVVAFFLIVTSVVALLKVFGQW